MNSSWYKYMNLYVVYPDAFKVGRRGDLNTLSDNLEYIKNLGFSAVHVLPFLKSPMRDAGFDVSDYYQVRKDLGGNEAFHGFIAQAQKLKLKVFMDLVINHVSNKHEWFKKAINGDDYYRHFFIHSPQKPELVDVKKDRRGTWAVYKLKRRKLKSRVIFVNREAELPHWVRGEDGFWYYHTFYSHQIDLNWTNPDLLREFAKIIEYWGEMGVNFRLDAAPFAGKSLSGPMKEGSLASHEVVEKLHKAAKKVDCECALLVEACQPVTKTKEYFGKDERPESELAYNFNLMQAIWAAVISKKAGYIWTSIEKTREIVRHAQWITFLRNHDELTLEYASSKVRKLVYQSLFSSGIDFREGYGLAGRTASFLNNNVRRILMAHMLLASCPGSPAVVYGDEVGKSTDRRNIKIDTRDSNRGKLSNRDFEKKNAREISSAIGRIFNTRLEYPEIAVSTPIRVDVHRRGIFSAGYRTKKGQLIVYINLTKKPVEIRVDEGSKVVLQVNGGSVEGDQLSLLPYAGVWVDSEG